MRYCVLFLYLCVPWQLALLRPFVARGLSVSYAGVYFSLSLPPWSHMNCLLETLAGTFMHIRARFIPNIDDDDMGDAEDTLESCRRGLLGREEATALECTGLGKEALARRRLGDVQGAKVKLMERRRAQQRLERLRGGLLLVDKQLDALRSSELDKELMQSLRLSSQAMKNAGVGAGLEDAEKVMSELDAQMSEATEMTSMLATPLAQQAGVEDDEIDVDAELGLVVREEEGVSWQPPAPAACADAVIVPRTDDTMLPRCTVDAMHERSVPQHKLTVPLVPHQLADF